MSTIKNIFATAFTLVFLLACGGGGSSSGGGRDLSATWSGTYREALAGGAFCQFNISGPLVQVVNQISGTLTLVPATSSPGAACVGGDWAIIGWLSGDEITVVQNGDKAVFTISNGDNKISGTFNFSENGQNGTVTVDITRS
jgi:hypothetical protein